MAKPDSRVKYGDCVTAVTSMESTDKIPAMTDIQRKVLADMLYTIALLGSANGVKDRYEGPSEEWSK